ncbi:MAG: ferritin-like domain-containing protein [Rhodospirillaceae bacterium]|nr:MAG: ferritin-like domain-containing protein [Rhodospirillaceae bacterium]
MTTADSKWTLNDIPWARFDRDRVSPDVLAVVKAASVVERNGADYGRYLANVFHNDPEFCAAAAQWAKEEEQHGLALGRWVEMADPQFNLDERFQRFTELYRIPVDATESVRGSQAAELCARCVVETGTSSLYSAIRDAVDEPVLKAICKNIAADEFRHYKLFYTHMERVLATENTGNPRASRWQRLKTAFTRFRETEDDEIASAYYASNDIQGAYDREAANRAYSGRVFGFYQERHVRRAGHMFAQAAGLNPDGIWARLMTRVLWFVIERRGREFRPLLSGV